MGLTQRVFPVLHPLLWRSRWPERSLAGKEARQMVRDQAKERLALAQWSGRGS